MTPLFSSHRPPAWLQLPLAFVPGMYLMASAQYVLGTVRLPAEVANSYTLLLAIIVMGGMFAALLVGCMAGALAAELLNLLGMGIKRIPRSRLDLEDALRRRREPELPITVDPVRVATTGSTGIPALDPDIQAALDKATAALRDTEKVLAR